MTRYTELLDRYLEQHRLMNRLMDELIANYSQGKNLDGLKHLIGEIILEFNMHFKEEEMLYKRYRQETTFLITIERLMSEHKLIMKKISEEKEKIKDKRADFLNIKKLLQIHEHIEEYTLYPELAQAISDTEQESIMDEIDEKDG